MVQLDERYLPQHTLSLIKSNYYLFIILGLFRSFLSDDRKEKRAWKKKMWAHKRREKANRKKMMTYRKKEEIFNKLQENVQTFINIQMNKAKTVNGRRYKEEEVALAYKIFSECPKAYQYMCTMFLLPSIQSLERHVKRKANV